MKIRIIVLPLLLIFSHAWAGEAKQYHSITQLKQLSKSYLEQLISRPRQGKVNIRVGHLDRRLKLAHCQASDIETFLPPGIQQASTATTVGVRCNNATPWTLYIPVKVLILRPVLVTTRPLARGSRISNNDLKQIDYDIKRLKNGYFQSKQAVVGQLIKRSLRLGAVVTERDVQLPNAVKRGENVIITAHRGGIDVTMHGKALMNGRPGDTIRIRSQSSNTVIQGRVIGTKHVEVML